MAALTGDRRTPERKNEVAELAVAAGVAIFRGAMTAINAAGLALRPQDAGATMVVGCATTGTADFFAQAGLNPGALPTGVVVAGPVPTVRIRHAAQFAYANSPAGADLVDMSCWGAVVYAVDDQTVAKTNGGGARLAAGVCRGVDAAGVWVQFS